MSGPMDEIDNQGESFQAHVCFVTTHAAEGLQPEPTILREERCHVVRDDPTEGLTPNAAGVYYIITTEDIGGATGDAADIDANVGATAGGVLNIVKIAPFIWQVLLYTVAGVHGELTLDDLIAANLGARVNITFRRVDRA